MCENAGLIEVKGSMTKVIYKNSNILSVTFFDTDLGEIILTAVKDECPLYYQFDRNKKYHLLAKLRGKTKIDEFGNRVTFNNLYIKKVLTEGR